MAKKADSAKDFVAAFSSYERVTATATDGWHRLTYLGSSGFEALTLSKGGN